MRKGYLIYTVAALLFFTVSVASGAVSMSSENYGMEKSALTGGSGEGTSESFEASGTSGQSSPVGDTASESFDANTGFYDDTDLDGDGVLIDVDACPLENSTGYDANVDGCIDSISGLVTVINTLAADVLSDETKNSLVSKVNAALSSVDRFKDDIAIKQLNSFINEVTAQKEKKVSLVAADMLIQYAMNIITLIELG